MTWLRIEPGYKSIFEQIGCATFDGIVQRWGSRHETKARTVVSVQDVPTERGTLRIFFKEYRFRRASWGFWLRRSKARCEFENYSRLEQYGLPVAQRVAAGEKRDVLGRLSAAWIITEAVPNSDTLLAFLSRRGSASQRRQVADALAGIVRRMHEHRFFYYDLFCRNILVSSASGTPALFVIDCPRGRNHRFRADRHRARDIASLDMDARKLCRRSERLRFVLRYLGKERLDREAKKFIRSCLAYAAQRWGH